MSNITQVVNAEKHMTTLKKGVKASGLNEILSSTGPFTLFAPSDLAFENHERAAAKRSRKWVRGDDRFHPHDKFVLEHLFACDF